MAGIRIRFIIDDRYMTCMGMVNHSSVLVRMSRNRVKLDNSKASEMRL